MVDDVETAVEPIDDDELEDQFWVLRPDGTVGGGSELPDDMVFGKIFAIRTHTAVDHFLTEAPEGVAAGESFENSWYWGLALDDGVCIVRRCNDDVEEKVLVRAYAQRHWMIVTSGQVEDV